MKESEMEEEKYAELIIFWLCIVIAVLLFAIGLK